MKFSQKVDFDISCKLFPKETAQILDLCCLNIMVEDAFLLSVAHVYLKGSLKLLGNSCQSNGSSQGQDKDQKIPEAAMYISLATDKRFFFPPIFSKKI